MICDDGTLVRDHTTGPRMDMEVINMETEASAEVVFCFLGFFFGFRMLRVWVEQKFLVVTSNTPGTWLACLSAELSKKNGISAKHSGGWLILVSLWIKRHQIQKCFSLCKIECSSKCNFSLWLEYSVICRRRESVRVARFILIEGICWALVF